VELDELLELLGELLLEELPGVDCVASGVLLDELDEEELDGVWLASVVELGFALELVLEFMFEFVLELLELFWSLVLGVVLLWLLGVVLLWLLLLDVALLVLLCGIWSVAAGVWSLCGSWSELFGCAAGGFCDGCCAVEEDVWSGNVFGVVWGDCVLCAKAKPAVRATMVPSLKSSFFMDVVSSLVWSFGELPAQRRICIARG
jgi:hypothetical protein